MATHATTMVQFNVSMVSGTPAVIVWKVNMPIIILLRMMDMLIADKI